MLTYNTVPSSLRSTPSVPITHCNPCSPYCHRRRSPQPAQGRPGLRPSPPAPPPPPPPAPARRSGLGLSQCRIATPRVAIHRRYPSPPASPSLALTTRTSTTEYPTISKSDFRVSAACSCASCSTPQRTAAASTSLSACFSASPCNENESGPSADRRTSYTNDFPTSILESRISADGNSNDLDDVALCSAVLGKPLQSRLVVLGSMSLGENIVPVENLAESLQVAFNSGAKRILISMASVTDIPTLPGELFVKFQTSFYADASDAAFKALGVE